MGTTKKQPTCQVCDGTGKLVLLRSWFPADGFRRARCGICAGTGVSSYRNSEYAASQRQLRLMASGQSDA